MNKRHITYVLIALMAAGVTFAIFLRKGGDYAASHSPGLADGSLSSAPPPGKSNPQPVATTSIKRQIPGGPYAPSDPRWRDFERKWKEDPGWEWKCPISFYGKVVDQDNNPVEGAHVRFDWTDTSPQGTSIKETTSDRGGSFSLEGQHGKFMTVDVSKDGYYTGRTGNHFDFEYASFSDADYYEPNPRSPVLFHLRKKGTAATLIHGDTRYGVTVDGTPHFFDLMTGRKQVGGSPTGDLAIRVIRSVVSPTYEYTWSASIEAVNGGVLQSGDEFMFEAPEGGYQQSIEVSGDRHTHPKPSFYFKSRGR